MRTIDWRALLTEQRVPYIESGPNVKRGELAIQCPFCGTADPSKHMGLNLETGWWSCWRNRSAHSGKSPLRLIMKLLGVPYGRARELAGLGAEYVDPEGFDAIAARMLGRGSEARPAQVERRYLKLEEHFRDISEQVMRTRRFWDYLHDPEPNGRGFSGASGLGEDVDALCEQYGLKADLREQRIIIPYYLDGELVTWTGRAIGNAMIRYKDLRLDDSILAPKETLFNHDAILAGGKALVVQEGPFDALKVDFYGQAYGVRSVALSTNSISEAQAFLLTGAEDKFEQLIVMMDNASVLGLADSMRMKQALNFIKDVSIQPVPFGAKDGGMLTSNQVIQWAQAL